MSNFHLLNLSKRAYFLNIQRVIPENPAKHKTYVTKIWKHSLSGFSPSRLKKNLGIITMISILYCSAAAFAEDTRAAELEQLKSELYKLQRSLSELNKLVENQQNQIEKLSVQPIVAKRAETEGGGLSSTTPAKTGSNSGSYLPNIGVVADIVGTSTQSQSEEEGNDRFAAREVEFVFSQDIDPYSYLNVVATFSDYEDPALEEANVTYLGLPQDIKAKIGRMRPRIGKATSTHRDALETVDEPLVVQQYLGIEGLYKTGLELSAFSPLSGENFTQEFVLGAMEGGTGEEGDMFDQNLRYQTIYSHMANFLEISDLSSFELGATFLTGDEDQDSHFGVKAFGIDATYQHSFNAVNKLKLQGESYFQNRSDDIFEAEDGTATQSRSSPYGFYTLADYRFAERWSTGVRYDYVQPSFKADNIADNKDAYSAYLTFHQSEFARWRLQYERFQESGQNDDNRFFLQGTFAIGAHKHQLN